MSTIALVLAWLLWGASALLFGLAVRGIRLRFAMKHWPRVRGVVREHHLESHRGPAYHRPLVVVAYTAAGRERTVPCDSPTRLRFAHREGAESAVKPFKPGKRVDVHVDPEDPDRAFLYPPETASLVMLFLGSLFLLVVGIGISNGAGGA